jgi:hypothetical protein
MNSKRKCALKSCGIRFRVETGIIKGVNAWCSSDHMIEWSIAAGRKLLQAKRSAQHKELKRRVVGEDRRHQFALTKAVAQRLANLLDAGKECICCGAPRSGGAQFCGGHYRTSGAHPELALDLRNIHGQRNATCNQHKSGNIAGDKFSYGYREGLTRRYGPDLVRWLDGAHDQVKLTCQQLASLRQMYSAEVKRLTAGDQPSRDWRSLSLPRCCELAETLLAHPS